MTVSELRAALVDAPDNAEVVVLADKMRPVSMARPEAFSNLRPVNFVIHTEDDS